MYDITDMFKARLLVLTVKLDVCLIVFYSAILKLISMT